MSIANANQDPLEALALSDLVARRQALTREQLELERRGCPYDPALTEGENARNQHDYQLKLSALVREQLQLMAVMRKTASGPAKTSAVKRKKKGPVDLSILEEGIF